MDTTETYIKMRVKAIPDLGWGIPSHMPVAFVTDNDNVYVDVKGDWYCNYHQGKDDAVIGCQLERQDQLQEMVDNNTTPAKNLAKEFGDWCFALPLTIPNAFASMEQLWLAFVMKEKYNKIWDGEDWH